MKKLVTVMILMCTSIIQAQEWNNDLDLAMREAIAKDKKILLLFSIPESCGVCEKLEKNVLQSEEFKAFAKENYILIRPDFSESAAFETKANNLLIVEKYNKDGFFPFVVILDKNAKVLGSTGLYNDETPQQYLLKLRKF
jgi:thioredoxin-related protein